MQNCKLNIMSLKPSRIDPVPELTAQIAQAAFPKGNPSLKLRDELGAIYDDEDLPIFFGCMVSPAAAGAGDGSAVSQKSCRPPSSRGGPCPYRLEIFARSRAE